MAARTRYYGVYVGVITLLAFHVQKGHGVKCYSCSSKNHEACLKPDVNEYTPVHCGISMLEQMRNNSKNINKDYEKVFDVDVPHLEGVDLTCLKVVVQDGNKKYVLRGCQLGLHSNLDICKKVQEKSTGMFKLIHCSKCNTDGCNSSDSFHFNRALILICLVFYQAISRL